MSYDFAKQYGELLSAVADERLRFLAAQYGSVEQYAASKTDAELHEACINGVNAHVDCITKGQEKHLVHLADSLVHLRLIAASKRVGGITWKDLGNLAEQQIQASEERYGSADEYVTSKTETELFKYGVDRIKVYLDLVKEGKGDPGRLLADCLNHLRFIAAKTVLGLR
jgi:hypothetical protein